MPRQIGIDTALRPNGCRVAGVLAWPYPRTEAPYIGTSLGSATGGVSVEIFFVISFLILGALYLYFWNKPEREQQRERDKKLLCPHCRETGSVVTRRTTSKQGISGGKAAGGVLTGGASVLFTGLSREQSVIASICTACGMEWVTNTD